MIFSASSDWWEVAAGCVGLAEGVTDEPLCGHASHGTLTLSTFLWYHT